MLHTATIAAVLLCLAGAAVAGQSANGTFYVATIGDDAWSGRLATPNRRKTDGPFATLERARDAVRALKAAGPLPKGGVTVFVRAGAYERATSFALTAEDSGTAEAPATYRAAPGAKVRLYGGRVVPAEAFEPATQAGILARLDPAARGHVLQADLKALGIADLGEYPVRFRGVPAVPELFFNDRRMALARWPNKGWAHIARIIESGSNPREGDNTGHPGVFEYDGDRPGRWNVEAGVWLQGYWCFDWYDEVIRIRQIDRGKRQIALAEPHLYSLKQGNPSPRRYCALNLLEELDQPGEYFIDRAAGRLYFWPPANYVAGSLRIAPSHGSAASDAAGRRREAAKTSSYMLGLKGARVVLSSLNAPIISLHDCDHVTLRGFTVEAGLGNGIEVKGGTGVRIQACEVRNTRQLGIHVNGGTHHRVEACDIHDTGTGGLVMDGGDRRTLTPAGHEAVNNHIWGFSRHQFTSAYGISLGGVGSRAAHNRIHDAPHQAVFVGGNDMVFELNVVYDVCTETDDCGAFYKGRNPSCRGNVVRHNFWHNIGSPMGHGNAAVYFDDGDGGDAVIGNVFFRCGEPGKGPFGTVFSHGGHDLLAENNVFIECRRAMGSAPWPDKLWREALDGGFGCFWTDRLLKEVDITRHPYTTHYPGLVGFMDFKPGQPRVSRATRNLMVMCGEVSGGNWQCKPEDNWVTDRDPGFVNAGKGDFRLRPDAEVLRKLPGFRPIPFEKIGLYADALRPKLPVERWAYPPPRPIPPQQKAAAAPARARTGPPPVSRVAEAAGPITVDGVIEPAEWRGADAAAAMPLALTVDGGKAERVSRAWLAYDRERLYVAVENSVHPETKLDGSEWGRHDAVEVSLRAVREGAKPPIYVIRGYGNGRLEFGTTPSGDDEPAPREPGDVQYKARIPAAGQWTAEFAIPVRMLDLDPAKDRRVAFNLTVRKALDNLWLMWAPTHAHSYDVDRAGFLEFVP